MNEHESNLIIGVRLLDSAIAVLQEVDFSKVEGTSPLSTGEQTFFGERSVSSLIIELDYLNRAYSNHVTGDPE